MDMSYLGPAVTVLNAIDFWPEPPNKSKVIEAMRALLDQAPADWVPKRMQKLTDVPDQIIHGGHGPHQKLEVRWHGQSFWFDEDTARALANTIPDP